ncbi:hypothetical protein Tco_0606409 [Tanacetum coccineum]
MSSNTKLTRDKDGESVDNTKYRDMISSLLYLMASRPVIMFSVCLCANFQEDPKSSHLEAVKRISRYIKGTTHLGLWYPKGTGVETIVYDLLDTSLGFDSIYVEFQRISLTGFRSCTSRSHYQSVSKQTTRKVGNIIAREIGEPILNNKDQHVLDALKQVVESPPLNDKFVYRIFGTSIF